MFNIQFQTISIGNDPSIYAWLVCATYIITSWFCLLKSKQLSENKTNALFWLGLGFLMLFLGINKQIDLQTTLVQSLKAIFINDDFLYTHRKKIQHGLVIAFICLLVISLGLLRFALAKSWHSFKLAWLGIFFIFGFIALRVAYFSLEAKVLIEQIDGYYQLLEPVGVLLILVASHLKVPKDKG